MSRVNISELAAEHHIARNVALKYLQDARVQRDAKKLYDHVRAPEVIQLRKDRATTDGNRLAGRAGGISDQAARIKLTHSKPRAKKCALGNFGSKSKRKNAP